MNSDTQMLSQFFLLTSSTKQVDKGTMFPCNEKLHNIDIRTDHDKSSNKESNMDITKTEYTNNILPKTKRNVKRPGKDYACQADAHWCKLVQHKALTASHKEISYAHSTYYETNTYKEASQDPLWIEDMNKELEALAKNRTWVVVTLPKGKRLLGVSGFIKLN